MNCSKFLLAAALSLGMGSLAQAQWTYYDVDATNTVNATTLLADWIGTSDTASPWRERLTTGPGAPAANLSAYTGRLGNVQSGADDPNLITSFTGLTPNTEYNVRVYGVFPNNATSRHFASFSTDGGTTFEFVDNRYNNNTDPELGPVGPAIVWVDATNGGLGADIGARGTSDTRYYSVLTDTIMSDANGNASVLLALALNNPAFSGGDLDRFNIDGYALAVVPEPSAIALLGLGGMTLVARRRK